ncbi:hypothetical protein Tco_1216478 [Tanacetum coccineum]
MANLDFCDKHNMVAYLQKSKGSEGFHQIIDFLTISHISTHENGDMEITATIDGKVKVVSEASIRRHLKLEYFDGISTLPTSEIFEQLALMGVDTPLFQTMLVQGQILQGEGSTIPVESHHTPISAPSTSQPPTLPPSMPITHVAEEAATMPHDSPLLRVHSLGSDEGSMTLNELTVLCTTLSKKVETLESDLKQTKLTYGAAYTKFIMKVKKLEHKVKSSKARRRVRLVVLEDKDELDDPSKQGRKIAQIDEDEGITLVQMSAQTQGRHEHDFEEPDFKFIAPKEDYTVEPDISNAMYRLALLVQKLILPALKLKLLQKSLVYIRRSAAKRKDKSKAIMKEAEPVQKKTKVHEEASTFNAEEWDNIQAQIEADEELAHRKRKFAQQRAEQRRNKPMTQAQQRTYMCNYINNMGSHTLQKLKKLSFDEIKELFETTMKRVNTFTPIESDDTVLKVVAGSSKRESLVHERFNSTEPTEDKERELWVELKRLFKPDENDILWKLQRYMLDPLKWRLYDTCVVHHVSTERGHDIFMLVEKDYPLTRALMTLMLCNKLQVDEYSVMADELLRKINRPRQSLGEDCWELRASTKFILLVQLSTAKRRLSTAQIRRIFLDGYGVLVFRTVVQNAVQNLRVQNVGNQNGLIVVPGIAPPIANQNANQNGNGNVVAARAEGNANRNNGNQIRCYNYRGLGIQLQAEEFDLMAAAGDIDEIKDVNANYVLMANLQQASTSAKADSFYHTEHKMALGYPNPHYLKQAQQKQQSMYNGRVLLEKHDPLVVYDSEETLQLAEESRLKIKQLNKEIKLANYEKINKLSKVFVSQNAKSREEVYFSNTSKTANVSTLFSIPDEKSSDDTPSVA